VRHCLADDRDVACGGILLRGEITVSGDEDVIAVAGGSAHQVAVRQAGVSGRLHGRDVMSRKQAGDGCRQHLVEDDLHAVTAASSVRCLAVSNTATACLRVTVGN
jgi:hypothetical protein